MMRFDLREFCHRLDGTLQPLNEALEKAVTALHRHREVGDDSWLKQLMEARQGIQTLQDKLAQQQAYLLIFGPLKSGKSTLMNAISGAYVSEVSSLPAYPCMVYVNHADKPSFALTRFDGTEETFAENAELQLKVQQGHETLARAIRQCDRAGRVFEPSEDQPEAIRRVDIGLTAPNLRDSGATLVDTPGLYSKMKFGYDLLTQEFRHNAACALFVVKTDNLFLEQVFEEFRGLLAYFSRIFLVVNIDSAKKDIGPDGKLHPSLESCEPRRVIEAFENLTMSAEMRQAIEEGRLRIYLIDLLEAATLSLHGDKFPLPSGGVVARETQVGPLSVTHGSRAFALFLRDLTDYLNSSDYTREFMQDNFRQAQVCLEKATSACAHPAGEAFADAGKALEQSLKVDKLRLDALGKLEAVDWQAVLQPAAHAAKSTLQAEAAEATATLLPRLQTHLQEWFTSNESIQNLIQDRLDNTLHQTVSSLRQRAIDLISEMVEAAHGGAELDASAVEALMNAECSLDGVAEGFTLPTAKAPEDALPATPGLNLIGLPVRKSLLDWLLFRSRANVRTRLLGPGDRPAQAIPAPLKARRLGQAGKNFLMAEIQSYLNRQFADNWTGLLQDSVTAYISHFQAEVTRRLQVRRTEVFSGKRTTENQLERHRQVQQALDHLNRQQQRTTRSCAELHQQFIKPRQQAVREEFLAETPEQRMARLAAEPLTQVQPDPEPEASKDVSAPSTATAPMAEPAALAEDEPSLMMDMEDFEDMTEEET